MLPPLKLRMGKSQDQDQGEVLGERKQKDFLDHHQHKGRKGNLESNQMGFKRLMSGREKEKYKALYKTMRNVIVGALNCRGINLDQREVNFHTPPPQFASFWEKDYF